MTNTTARIPTDAIILSLAYDCSALPETCTDATLLVFARAVLAKWGAPAPASQPVAVPAGMQPVASESLVKWASLIELAQTDWHTGYEAARAYVKVQLECATPQPAAPAQAGEQNHLPLAITSAPERIWLDLGFNPYGEDAHFSNLHGLTWSKSNATGDGIEYVRADLAARGAAQAAPVGMEPVAWIDMEA